MIKVKPKANPRTKPKPNSKSISKRGGVGKINPVDRRIYPVDDRGVYKSLKENKPSSSVSKSISSAFRTIISSTNKVGIEPEPRATGGAKRKRGGVFPFSIFRSKKVAPSDLPSQRRRTPSPQRRQTTPPQRRRTTPPQPPHTLTMTGHIRSNSNKVVPVFPRRGGPQPTGRVHK